MNLRFHTSLLGILALSQLMGHFEMLQGSCLKVCKVLEKPTYISEELEVVTKITFGDHRVSASHRKPGKWSVQRHGSLENLENSWNLIFHNTKS